MEQKHQEVAINPIEQLQEGEISLDFLQQSPTRDYSILIREAEKNVLKDERILRTNYSDIWSPYSHDEAGEKRQKKSFKTFKTHFRLQSYVI